MVRGNWQKRVEAADTRRKDAKQRKHRSDEKRIFKSRASEVLALLDLNMDAIRRRSSGTGDDGGVDGASNNTSWNIHIWTDTLPSGCPPFFDIVQAGDTGGGKQSRKGRSISMDETNLAIIENNEKGKKGARHGRGRSGSFQEGGSKKKVHPRSHQSDMAPLDEAKSFAPLLCKSQFFAGKCLDPQKSGKKSGCRCVHFNNKQMKTLAAVLAGSFKRNPVVNNNKQPNAQVAALEKAEEVCSTNANPDIIKSNPGSMEVVYYLTLPLPKNIGESLSSDEDPTTNENDDDYDDDMSSTEEPRTPGHPPTTKPTGISDLIIDKLGANDCSIASIAYLVISSPSKRVLLYDRNQDGLVVTDFASDVLGAADSAPGDVKLTAEANLAQDLPVSILEHVLAYLEASGVASVAQVCTAWHREIKHASPSLWRHLLDQRKWPIPAHMPVDDPDSLSSSLQDTEMSETVAKCLRDEFIKHYSVLRDLRAVQSALTGLLTKKSCGEQEMTFQAFSTRRDAPQAPNNCVSVEVWGPNQVLTAYSNDCTLRLFQAVPRGSGNLESDSGNLQEKFCRELVCQTIDPYKHTKKKSCFMEAMGLDEDVIGCLLNVSDDTNDCKSPHILVILKRDDLLVADFSSNTAGTVSEPEEGSLHVINVEDAVLNYILSLDHVDHRLLRLHDFLALGGDEVEIEFIVSQSMTACGYGRFIVEVAISIPFPDDDDDNIDAMAGEMLLLDRKLFLFSSSVGAIVWMGDSNPANEPLRPRLEDMTLAGLRRAPPGSGTRSSCSVAAVSHAFAPFVMGCEIDNSGHIDANFALGSSEWTQNERMLEEGWTPKSDGRRPLVVTPTDVVVGDSLTRVQDENDNEREYKSIITFYSRFPTIDDNENAISKLLIGENCMIDRMVSFRDDYIVILVRFFTDSTGFPADRGGGHWGNELDRVARVFAITIHVPSRREIERLCLYEDFGWNRLSLAVCGETVACGVWLKGLIMTGQDVRSVKPSNAKSVLVLDDAIGSKATKKKKKKGRSKGGNGRKDGFARGMSKSG